MSAQRLVSLGLAGSALLLAGCGGGGGTADGDPSAGVTLYTCASDEVVQPVVAAFEKAYDGARVDLFRAPTGELNARVAADVRSGGLRADVVWACDPLTMQSLVAQDLVGGWVPDDLDGIRTTWRTGDSVAAHVLYVVVVHRDDVPAPTSWEDLTTGDYTVALPDPAFAASALGALGYFATSPSFGMEFLERLRRSGAEQVSTPDEVTVGVARGSYQAGLTIATSAYRARQDGSPVDVAWPAPGAVAVHGPVGAAAQSADDPTTRALVSFIVGQEGQEVIGAAGGYPARDGAGGPEVEGDVVAPDWETLGRDRDELLAAYRKVFGG